MSLIQAEEKLKEFVYCVSASTARWLSNAFEALKRFYESATTRIDLMVYIRHSIERSIKQACERRVLECGDVIHLVGDVMYHYGLSFTKIVADADIQEFMKFLDEVIRRFRSYPEYLEWTKKTWEEAKELVKTLFKE